MRFIKLSAFMAFMLVNAVLLLSVVSVRALPAGGGAGDQATRNGDVNGDGSLDISDAVYLLKHLFSGGADPVACAGPIEADCCNAIVSRLESLEATIASRPAWPPRPEDLVRLTGRSGPIEEIYSVPVDRWLIVTNTDNHDCCGGYLIYEQTEGGRAPKIETPPNQDFRSAVGVAFAPGSKVLLDGSNGASYNISGYLVDA